MDSGKQPKAPPNPVSSFSKFFHHQFNRLGSKFTSRIEDGKLIAGTLISIWPAAFATVAALQTRPCPSPILSLPFASVGQSKHAFDVALSSDHVAKTLTGTSVYTVSNTNNEFVLISDSDSVKSIGLLCFRREDAEAYLAQVQSRRRELRSQAKVVPITLEQVYLLKVEGIAFRFLPDPIQIRNAVELRAAEHRGGFDGVPVFQSELLVLKRKNKRYCPIYFQKEDIEKELLTTRGARLGVPPQIMVGSLEDVLRKMEISEKNSGWDDLIFVPPGKSCSQHLQEVAKA